MSGERCPPGERRPADQGEKTQILFNRRRLIALLAGFGAGFGRAAPVLAQSQPESEGDVDALVLPKPWLGDFDGMRERRQIRFLVPFSKTIYFLDKGEERGVSAEFGREFEKWLNKRYKLKTLKISVLFIPTARDKLFSALNEGLGDVIAANLTVTPERQKIVDFSIPIIHNVNEIVVTGPAAPKLVDLNDLGGQAIQVRRSSSYYVHLQALSRQLATKGFPPIDIRPCAEDLEDEDLLEMVNAGLLPLAVVDDHKARLWSKIFTELQLRSDLAINTGGEIAWAIRKNSPLLLEETKQFCRKHGMDSDFGAAVIRKYYVSTSIVTNAYSEQSQAEFRALTAFFKKYADTYGFDYLMMAAQGYQESRLQQSMHNPSGAVGIMQILPSTAADPNIAIKGIDVSAERNIEAGTKYLRFLADTYLDDPNIDPKERTLMAFAAYNAGPKNLQRFRSWAARSGLNPDVWFYNVEEGAARIVGQQPVIYVSNIYKYYVAYQLLSEREMSHQRSRQSAKERMRE